MRSYCNQQYEELVNFPRGNNGFTLTDVFTGIVEKTVRVVSIVDSPKFRRLILAADWQDVSLGQSIAVNGCCLTIAEIGRAPHTAGELAFDVIAETLEKTNLGMIVNGDRVNVERSLKVGDRIDGHFVQGHIDGLAALKESARREGEWRLKLECTADLARYIIPKGSITLDGVSLTVAAVSGNIFEVALIPTTMQLTTLGEKPLGWPCNLEADVLSKTIVSWLERQQGRRE
jgi:riboflavin synthase